MNVFATLKQSSSEANSCQALFLLTEHRVVISYPLSTG